jgi:membrane protein DedA with SNARE-associated domain
MDALLQPISTFVADHHAWAGLVLGLATFLESLVLIGAFIPATALMLLAGGLIATGALDAASVLLWSATGAALGDAASYALGSRMGGSVLRGRFFRPHRRSIARTRLFARRYGVGSIFLGRFLGPLRAFVPVMAGMVRMKAQTFQVANVASAFVWVAALVSPGYLAGKGLSSLQSLSGAPVALTAITVLVASALLAATVVLLRRKPILATASAPIKITRVRDRTVGAARDLAQDLGCCPA